MDAAQAVLVAAYLVSGLLPLALLGPTLDNWGKPGSSGLLLLFPGILLWSLASALLTLGLPAPVAFGVYIVLLTGVTIVSLGFFLSTAEYTGLVSITGTVWKGIAGLLLAKGVIEWTNPLHQLVLSPGTVVTSTNISVSEMGPFFLVHMGLNYGLFGAGLLLILGEILTASGIRRKQSLALLGGAIPAFSLNVLFLFVLPLSFDPTPFGFILTAFVMGWAFFSEDFLDVVPVGRRIAVESMEDPMVVVDDEGRVVDSNPEARRIADVSADWETLPVSAFFADIPADFETLLPTEPADHELSVTRNGRQRHFDLNVSPIRGPHGDSRAHLVVLRDITLLKEREQELNLMRQVQSRVLRHNIRNDLQLVKLNNELLADRLDGEEAMLAREAYEQADELVTVSTKARTVEQLIETEQTPVTIDLATTVQQLVEQYSAEFPTVEFSLTTPDSSPVESIQAVELMLENLVENAAEHNDAEHPTVEVVLTTTDEHVTIVISDNGPGIPDQELSVRRAGEETALHHGSGIGLWVVDWVVTNSTASIAYETGADGTAVTVEIPR